MLRKENSVFFGGMQNLNYKSRHQANARFYKNIFSETTDLLKNPVWPINTMLCSQNGTVSKSLKYERTMNPV